MRVLLYLLLLSIVSVLSESRLSDDEFPEDFSIGAGTSAYQIEGAWNEDGKGPSTLDTYTHAFPDKTANRSNADVSTDSYHRYRSNVRALASMAMQHYSFGFSWSRILPDGSLASLNMDAIDYYKHLIDELIRNGIEPVGTMTRLDVPQVLQNLGGFTNAVVVEYFKIYADVLFHFFGDRVKRWITFDEPYVLCSVFYGNGYMAPVLEPVYGISQYLCAHNALKAHATAYWLYRKYYAKRCKGKVGITLYSAYYISKRDNPADVKRALDFELGWFGHPIFSRKGNYPAVMRRQIRQISLRQGYDRSRLPKFSKRWIRKIRGSADFMGLAYFTTYLIQPTQRPLDYYEFNDHPNDALLNYTVKPDWIASTTSYVYFAPHGLSKLMSHIREEYRNPEVLITRTGWSDDGELNDQFRIHYLRAYLKEALKSLSKGSNLVGFTVWSLMDSFEYRSGYTTPFGLFSVDFSSPRKTLTPKASADFMRRVCSTRRIPSS